MNNTCEISMPLNPTTSFLMYGGKVVGQSRLTKLADASLHEVVITQYKLRKDQVGFNIYLKDQTKGIPSCLGNIQIRFLRVLPSGEYGSKTLNVPAHWDWGGIAAYGNENAVAKANRIFVDTINATHKSQYKGIGTVLMQAAMEYGLRKNCEGRIQLDAVGSSHGFYYKLGLRSTFEYHNEAIADELMKATKENRAPNTLHLRSFWMHLPSTEIPQWLSKIEEHPILYKTPKKTS